MLKIAVFGFFQPDSVAAAYRSPVSSGAFMRTVWEMEPPATRIGSLGTGEAPCFVKLTTLGTSQPVYVQLISERLASGAGLLNCDGYVLILDAVKILAPHTIHSALMRLHSTHPGADLIIAAGRQNEPEALSSDEIRALLGLNPALPIYPYVPEEPKTVHRLIRRLARYVDNPDRIAPPIFTGVAAVVPPAPPDTSTSSAAPAAPPAAPHIHGLDHVAITVSNLERALEFYQGILGFRLLGYLDPHDERGAVTAYLDTGHGRIELFSFTNAATQQPAPSDNTQIGLRHLALRVTGLDAIAEQLACAGVTFTMTPKTSTLSGIRLAFFTDPDGTLIELVEGDLNFTRPA